MDDIELIKTVFNFGAPALLAFYVIKEVNSNIKSLTTAIVMLSTRLEEMEARIARLDAKIDLILRSEHA